MFLETTRLYYEVSQCTKLWHFHILFYFFLDELFILSPKLFLISSFILCLQSFNFIIGFGFGYFIVFAMLKNILALEWYPIRWIVVFQDF